MVKRLSLPAFLVLSFFLFSQNAAAQSADGPFFSKQALVDYWAAHPTGNVTEIFLNGYRVYVQPSGFGPAFVPEYFQCSDGLIRSDCNTLSGPFLNQSAAVSYVDNVIGSGAESSTFIWLDGALIQGSFGPAFGQFYFKTCYGDTSIYYGTPVRYLVLDHGSTIYGSIAGIACLPHP